MNMEMGRPDPTPEQIADSKARILESHGFEVPDDWELEWCGNAACDNTVWVPPGLQDSIDADTETKVNAVVVACRTECAIEIARAAGQVRR